MIICTTSHLLLPLSRVGHRRRGKRIDFAVYVLTSTVAGYYQSKDHDARRRKALSTAFQCSSAAAASGSGAGTGATPAAVPPSPSAQPPLPREGWDATTAMGELSTEFAAMCDELDEIAQTKGVEVGAVRVVALPLV